MIPIPFRRLLAFGLPGLIAFAVLAVRFCPNWIELQRGFRSAHHQARSPAEHAVIDRCFTTTIPLARGAAVARQVTDLQTEVTELKHSIVRWRLLLPALGHFLHLPASVILALGPLGSGVLVLVLVALILNQTDGSRRRQMDALCFGIVAGASAPVLTSLGWLGYFDAWVAVGLLAVAYSPSRAGVVLACLLTPWIDERFVLGLPVALAVRGCRFAPAAFHWWPWFRREAVPPLALVTAYAIIRLQLGGTGASQTVSQYLHTFVFERRVASTRLLFGAWEGLRVGWVLVFAAIVGLGAHSSSRPPRAGLWLGVLTLLAVLGGLFTAMDLSRSMMLAIPVLPLGWLHLARTAAWRRFWGAIFCASAALALPATHVMSDRLVPVDQLWSPPYALLAATTNIGSAHVRGDGIPADATTAVHWFQKAAAHGFVDAEFNLGVMYSRGEGMPRDATAAFDWYLRAANQGDAIAQSMVGTAYFRGDGVAKDQVAAARWFERAARQGDLDAQHNLGVIYASGLGVPRNLTRAVQWSRTAAGRNHAAAQVLLGRCYQNGEGVPRDPVLAGAWFALAAGQGYEAGLNHHRMLETTLTPAQRTAVSQAALALAKEINANR